MPILRGNFPMGNRKVSEEAKKLRKRTTIMKPSTFRRIVEEAKKRGYDDPEAVAGAAYWRAAEAKAKKRRKKK